MKRIFAFSLMIMLTLNIAGIARAEENCSAWAKKDIAYAESVNLIPDSVKGSYTAPLTRGEFAHMAVRLISVVYDIPENDFIESADSNVFGDTSDKYINAVAAFGIVSGMGDGNYYPENHITRQEAAKILVNTYTNIRGQDIRSANLLYRDGAEIADWAKPYVNAAGMLGIMGETDNGKFEPNGTYTAEQGVVTFARMYRAIKNTNAANPDKTNPTITSMLTAKNGYLYGGGNEVLLNGVNIGNWLLMEAWMSPIDAVDGVGYSEILSTLTSRFGVEKTNELIKAYEDNYITEADFDKIESLGFNCVRIPFWYRNFMDEGGNWLTGDISENPGFNKLDWALEQCAKHNIYAVLDMHGCPGGQSMNHSTGDPGKNGLYDNEQNLSVMERLWCEIAKRYKDNIYVAAYDIMNEPQNNGNATGDRAWQAESAEAVSRTNAVYDRMIKAIRTVDENHIITVEGIWSVNVLPNPADNGWNNMMYQVHLYDNSGGMIDFRIGELTKAREEYGIAVLVGEYNNKTYEKYASDEYAKNKINKIKWTYKTVNVGYDGWGLMNKSIDRLNISTEPYEKIMDVFKNQIRTENGFTFDEREYNMIK